MTAIEIITIAAILAAPILAVQAQRVVDRYRAYRDRQERVFDSLMATRALALSAEHVRALNAIDTCFAGFAPFNKRFQSRKERRVIKAWRTYLDHFGDYSEQSDLSSLARERARLFGELMECIAEHLRFEFDRVLLTKGVYLPRGHAETEEQERLIRQGLARVLSGESPLPVALLLTDEELDKQATVSRALLELLQGERALHIRDVPVPIESALPGSSKRELEQDQR